MHKGELKPVDIHIAGKTFPLRVTEEEAAWIQNLEDEINQKILNFQKQYAPMDKTDSIIMTLLTYAFENKQNLSRVTPTEDNEVGEKLDDILQMLSVH